MFASRHRQLIPLAAAHAMGLACGIVGVQWTSSVVPPALLGWYGLLITAVQIALVVTHQGLVKHVQRVWSPRISAEPLLKNLLRAMVRPSIWLLFGLGGVLAILHFTGGVPATPEIYLWLLFANIGIVAGTILQTALQAEERYWAGFVVATLGSVTRSFGPPLLVTLMGATLGVMASAFLFHVLVLIAVPVFFLHSSLRRHDPDGSTSSLMPRGLGALAAAGLFGWIAAAAPRWLAALTLDLDNTGFFVLAGNLSLIVPAAAGSIMLAYSFPKLFERARQGADTTELKSINRRTVLVTLAVSQLGILALAALAPLLVGNVISSKYAPSTEWLLATGNATLAATTGQFYYNVLLARGRESSCVILSGISLGVRLVCMFAGAMAGADYFRWSLIALPWATVLVETLTSSWLLRK